MAVPTISAITPNLGQAMGKNTVKLTGTNFSTFGATVTLNGQQSPGVVVVTATEAYFVAPRNPQGTYDLVFQNLDANGNPISGEVVTVPQGYTFRRPFYDAVHRSIYARLAEAIVALFLNDLFPTAQLSSSPDFDPVPDPANYIDRSAMPAIVMFGPQLRAARKHTPHRRTTVFQDVAGPPARLKIRRHPRTRDLVFPFVVLDLVDGGGAKQRNVNQMAALQEWFDANGYVTLQKNPDDPSQGTLKYPIQLEGDLQGFGEPNASGVKAFRGTFSIMNVTVEDAPGMVDDSVVQISGRLTTPISLTESQKE